MLRVSSGCAESGGVVSVLREGKDFYSTSDQGNVMFIFFLIRLSDAATLRVTNETTTLRAEN